MNAPHTMTWLMEDRIVPAAGLSLADMTVAPGATTETHRHPNCTEAIYALENDVEIHMGDDVVALVAGKTILIPAGCRHHIRNPGIAPARLILAYSAGTRIYEKVS